MEKKKSDEAVKTSELELAKLEERQAFISKELSGLATEGGREAKLREKFGVGRPGEQVAIIVEGSNDSGSVAIGQNFWAKIKEFFKSLLKK